MLGRHYIFVTNRFMSVDPMRDGWNLYSYVGNNPILSKDPSGLAVYVIIVGEAGLDGHNDVGPNFQRVAETQKAELEAAGHTVRIEKAGTVEEINQALTGGAEIDGGVIIVSHGSWNAIYIGEGSGTGTNVDESNVSELSNEKLGKGCGVTILACFTGSGGDRSIAQDVADGLQRPVTAPTQDLSFSGDKSTYLSAPGARPPAQGNLYMVLNPRGEWVTLQPRKEQ